MGTEFVISFHLAVDDGLHAFQVREMVPPAVDQVLLSLLQLLFQELGVQLSDRLWEFHPSFHLNNGLMVILEAEEHIMQEFPVLREQQSHVVVEYVLKAPRDQLVVNESPRGQVILVFAVLMLLVVDRQKCAEEVVQVLSQRSVHKVVLVVERLSLVLRLALLDDVVVDRLWHLRLLRLLLRRLPGLDLLLDELGQVLQVHRAEEVRILRVNVAQTFEDTGEVCSHLVVECRTLRFLNQQK